MGSRRSVACAALVAALLLAMSAPALAGVGGSIGELVDRTERTVSEVDDRAKGVVGGVDDVADEVEGAVDEVEGAVKGVVGDGSDDGPDDGSDDEPRSEGSEETRRSSGDRSELASIVQAVGQTVPRASPASALPLFRVQQSHQTSLQHFRIAEMAATDVVEASPTLDDVLEPVVRAETDGVTPANETPIIAAPAHAEAIAATPDGSGYTALAAAVLILLVSTALLAEVRARSPEST